MNVAIIYTVGRTYSIYLNLSDEEADRRWDKVRSGRNRMEIAYEEKMGYEVRRERIEFEDELMIWGDVGKEVNEMLSMMLSGGLKL